MEKKKRGLSFFGHLDFEMKFILGTFRRGSGIIKQDQAPDESAFPPGGKGTQT